VTSLTLCAKLLIPQISFDKQVLDFGSVILGDRSDLMLRITNETDDVTLDYSFNRPPFYSTNPQHGRLLTAQTQEVVVTFRPVELGDHEEPLILTVGNNLRKYEFRLVGHTLTPIHHSLIKSTQLLSTPVSLPPLNTRSLYSVTNSSLNQMDGFLSVSIDNPNQFMQASTQRRRKMVGKLRSLDEIVDDNKPNFSDVFITQAGGLAESTTSSIVTQRHMIWEAVKESIQESKESPLTEENEVKPNTKRSEREEYQKNRDVYTKFLRKSQLRKEIRKKGVDFLMASKYSRNIPIINTTDPRALVKTNYIPADDPNLGIDVMKLDKEYVVLFSLLLLLLLFSLLFFFLSLSLYFSVHLR
jgi:hypothetical protein